MKTSLTFTRIFFFILSIFFMTTYMLSMPFGTRFTNGLIGLVIGVLFGCILIGFDRLFRSFNLRSFNIALLGLLIGYFMGEALNLIFRAILDISSLSIVLQPQVIEIIQISLFLFGTYLGTIMTIRSSDELYVSIPFVRLTSATPHQKKDLVIDSSILADARIIDLASSGLLDHFLIVPRFVVKDLYSQGESSDESIRSRAKRSLENLKKLEEMHTLDIRLHDTDFPEIQEINQKIIRLARLLDAHLFTADINRVQATNIEGVQIINLNALSQALKPLMQAGESIKIKIQRYGKEPRQGVGYLEDGTMVVVNGGGDFIGETIDALVLSVKHTSSGRIIFCNAYTEKNTSPYVEEE